MNVGQQSATYITLTESLTPTIHIFHFKYNQNLNSDSIIQVRWPAHRHTFTQFTQTKHCKTSSKRWEI